MPLDSVDVQQAIVKFTLNIVKSGVQMSMNAESFNSGNGIATAGAFGFGYNVNATNFQISFTTAGTWNGGDGFTYANWYRIYSVKQ